MKFQTHFTCTAVYAAVATLLSAPVLAQTPETIETLTVTGTRLPVQIAKLPASVSVLTEQDIQASGAVQLTDLIRGLPGVSLSQSGSPGGLTELRVRGSESNHLLVLIDGVVSNDIGQGSLIDLAHLTSANVVRIELLRGPQSALWGSGAIGGVLSITTKAGEGASAKPSINLSAGIGTQGTYQGSINAATQNGDVAVRTYANYLKTDGDNISRVGNEDDGYDNMTAGINVDYALADAHTLSAKFRSTQYENDYDGTDYVTTGLPADADNVTDGSQLSTKLAWRYAPDASAYASTVSFDYRKDDNDNTTSGVDAGGTTGERLALNWTSFYNFDNWQVAGGAEYLQRLFEQRGPVVFGDPNQKQHDNTTSLFGEATGDLVDNVFATLSARFDNNSEFDDAVSYRAGLTWQVSKTYALFSSYGKAIKTPTFTERFGYFPDSFIGNPDLTPEESEEWEVGVKADWNSVTAQMSAYSAQLEDEINGFVYDATQGVYTAANVDGESSRDGADVEVTWLSDLAKVSASYSYLDADQTSFGIASTELRRARHQGALSVLSDLGTEKFSLYAKLAYTGTHYDTYFPPYPANAETLGLSAYTLASVNLGYQVSEKWALSLKVNNLFDTDYEDIVGYAGQERRALLSVSYNHQ